MPAARRRTTGCRPPRSRSSASSSPSSSRCSRGPARACGDRCAGDADGQVARRVGGAVASTALRRAGLLVTASVLAGLTATAIIQGLARRRRRRLVANAAALSLVVLALASVVAGLQALLGPAGVVIGALTMILIGNPFSGIGSAPEMLPEPAGAIGRLMPPGAGGNLLRSTGCFDGAGAGCHIAVLAAWAAAGLVLLLAAALRARRGVAVPAPVPA